MKAIFVFVTLCALGVALETDEHVYFDDDGDCSLELLQKRASQESQEQIKMETSEVMASVPAHISVPNQTVFLLEKDEEAVAIPCDVIKKGCDYAVAKLCKAGSGVSALGVSEVCAAAPVAEMMASAGTLVVAAGVEFLGCAATLKNVMDSACKYTVSTNTHGSKESCYAASNCGARKQKAGEACLWSTACEPGFFCHVTHKGAGICTATGKDGDWCSKNVACGHDSYCDVSFTCTPKLNKGDRCMSSSHCKTGLQCSSWYKCAEVTLGSSGTPCRRRHFGCR